MLRALVPVPVVIVPLGKVNATAARPVEMVVAVMELVLLPLLPVLAADVTDPVTPVIPIVDEPVDSVVVATKVPMQSLSSLRS